MNSAARATAEVGPSQDRAVGPVLAPATITTVAGNGAQYSANGLGLSATFARIAGVASIDGRVYIATSDSIRVFDPASGNVTKLAGVFNDTSYHCSDSPIADQVTFWNVSTMASDSEYIYTASDVQDSNCGGIRRTSVATGATSHLVSGNFPVRGMAVGPDGFIYATEGTYDIWKIDPATGIRTVFATAPGWNHFALAADATDLWVTAVEESGSGRHIDRVQLSDSSRIPFVSSSQVGTTTLVSTGDYLYGPGAGFQGSNSFLRRYSKADGNQLNIAGTSSPGLADGTGTEAWFNHIAGLASDGTSLWIGDATNNRLRKAVPGIPLGSAIPEGLTVTSAIGTAEVGTVAGSGTHVSSNGLGELAGLAGGGGVAFAAGQVYVATADSVRRYDPATGMVSTLAGTLNDVGTCTNGPIGDSVRFRTSTQITTDGSYIYTASTHPECLGIRRTSLITGATSFVVRGGIEPRSVIVGPDGWLYATDGNSQIWKIDPVNETRSVFATIPGSNLWSLTADATDLWVVAFDQVGSSRRIVRVDLETGTVSPFVTSHQVGLGALTSAGDFLYGTGYGTSGAGTYVRRYSKADGSAVDIAGTASKGYADGVGDDARFGHIHGMVSDGTTIWISDLENNRLRSLRTASELPHQAIASGGLHTCAVRIDRSAACWGGDNQYGERNPPVGNFEEVTSGGKFSCLLRTDATVTCWGQNTWSQVSPPPGTFLALAAGSSHACGLRTNAEVVCWGDNTYGQQDAPGGTFRAVSAGGAHSCGIRSDGSLECWGQSDSGQLEVPSGSFISISSYNHHSCAVRNDQMVLCWGDDTFGQSTPPLLEFESVAAGGDHTCGVLVIQSVECWGRDTSGQATPPGGFFASVTAGYAYSCGVTLVNSVSCWGNADSGQLGESVAITSAPPPGVRLGDYTYLHTYTATGAPAPSYTVTSGALPPGISLDETTGLLSGTPTIPGDYSGTVTASNGLFATDSQQFSITVGPRTSTATSILGISPTQSVTGQPVLVEVRVESITDEALPTGSIEVKDTSSGETCVVVAAQGTCELVPVVAGGMSLIATYALDGGFDGSESGVVVHPIEKAATIFVGSSHAFAGVVGESIQFAAPATIPVASPGSGSPTGTVTFSNGPSQCLAALGGSCSLVFDSAGTYDVFAVYNGDANYLESSDPTPLEVVIGKAATALVVAGHTDAGSVGAPVSFPAPEVVSVLSPGAGTPTGTVTFNEGANTCTASLGDSCTIIFSTPGVHLVTATYDGDENFLPSVDTSPIEVTVVISDVTCDGQLEAVDALVLLRKIAGFVTPPLPVPPCTGDLDGDGAVTLTDVLWARRRAAGLLASLAGVSSARLVIGPNAPEQFVQAGG